MVWFVWFGFLPLSSESEPVLPGFLQLLSGSMIFSCSAQRLVPVAAHVLLLGSEFRGCSLILSASFLRYP